MNVVTPFPNTKAGAANRRPPPPLKKPLVYFGGRMTMCHECDNLDWRHMIVGWDTLPDGTDGPVHPTTVIDFGAFRYGGPYLHDRTGGHAVGHGTYEFGDEEAEERKANAGERQRIWDADRFQIGRCDLFVCWLEDTKAFGSLVEIGIAHALNKPVILGFSLKMSPQDAGEMWFATMAASAIYDAASPKEFWWQVCRDWIAPGGGRVA